ncbi:MAG: redoxin domain-containing protein [Desulfocapsaceae bacterium]|nr:redoxin domain-containing protein [Desulfocapsaceae bacterium]
MKTKSLPALFALLIFCLLWHGKSTAFAANETMPDVSLQIPENEEYRKYLGINGAPGDEFRLADIDTDILLIELFSMYCPYCQAEAPLINEFYELATAREQEDGTRIKVIGLGASNTKFEVEFFKDKYEVRFPMFPDEDLSLYKTFKGEGTPGFIGVLYKDSGNPLIILRQSGGFEGAEEFLALLLQRAGYQ